MVAKFTARGLMRKAAPSAAAPPLPIQSKWGDSECEFILAAVAECNGVDKAALLAMDKRAAITSYRFLGMYLCRERTGLSYERLARVFNREDPGTIANGCERFRAWLKEYPSLRAELAKVEKLLDPSQKQTS